MEELRIVLRHSRERRDLRRFGLAVGTVLLLLGLVALWRGREIAPWLLAGGGFLGLTGLLLPRLLRWLYIPWMIFAVLLGWVMTRVVLSLTFYLMITPIGLLMRLFGHDPLHRRFPGGRPTYWRPWEEPQGGNDRYYRPF